jgi:hypothetical protein
MRRAVLGGALVASCLIAANADAAEPMRPERTGKWAFFGTGLGLFAPAYTFSLLAVVADPPPKDLETIFLAIPGAGPLASLVVYATKGEATDWRTSLLALDTAFQLVGITLIGISIALPAVRWVPLHEVAFAPVGPSGSAGLTVSAAF